MIKKCKSKELIEEAEKQNDEEKTRFAMECVVQSNTVWLVLLGTEEKLLRNSGEGICEGKKVKKK